MIRYVFPPFLLTACVLVFTCIIDIHGYALSNNYPDAPGKLIITGNSGPFYPVRTAGEAGNKAYREPDIKHKTREKVTIPSPEVAERKAVENSLTLLVNRDEVIPLTNLENGRFAILIIGEAETFTSRLNDYLEMPVIKMDMHSDQSIEIALQELAQYNRIITGIAGVELPEDDSNKNSILDGLPGLLHERESVTVFFGSPSALSQWRGIETSDGLLMTYHDSPLAQDLAAQLIFGAIGASGTLSESAGKYFHQGWGLTTTGGLRLKYTIPEEAGLDSRLMHHRVDSIVGEGLDRQAFPGCRVLVAREGKVILNKAWGHHTYSGRITVKKDDLYDLASVTKISGPLPLYMNLVDMGALDLDRPMSYYWDDWESRLFRRSNKEDLILRDILAHQAGIKPGLNFWGQTLRRGHYKRRWYRHEPMNGYSVEIGSHLYLTDNIRKRVYRDIRRSDLLSHGEYRYSCIPFIVSPVVIASVDGRPYTDALYEDFFRPLGASTLRYNPLHHFPANRIVPTEVDNKFRRKLVHGYVHDESSAVLGGISGNAGLFSSAGDLAKLLQMYLNGGVYGGKRYLSQDVVTEFTSVQFPENENRRGVGFDKPVLDNAERSPERAYPCPGASPASFGHFGFTGTFVWMDPEHDLLYIFLSNRVYPTRDNNLISTLNIRTEILQVFYDLIEEAGSRQVRAEAE